MRVDPCVTSRREGPEGHIHRPVENLQLECGGGRFHGMGGEGEATPCC